MALNAKHIAQVEIQNELLTTCKWFYIYIYVIYIGVYLEKNWRILEIAKTFWTKNLKQKQLKKE